MGPRCNVSDGHNNPDWTVGLKLVARPDGRWIITDVVRLRGTLFEVEQVMVETAERDGELVRIGIPEDPGQAGKVQAAYLTRRLAGRIVVASRETGSKLTRAAAVSSQIEAGNILMTKATWNSDFVEELGSFPYADKDDQVDALCRAFGLLAGAPPGARCVQLPLIGR
jgi:predicted phage terminase large subunit-like protein